jgi:hypothetical protein
VNGKIHARKKRETPGMKKRSFMLPILAFSAFTVFCTKPNTVQLPYDVQVESIIGLSDQDKKDIIDLSADLSGVKVQKIRISRCVQLTDCMTGNVEFVPETLQNNRIVHRSCWFSNRLWNGNDNYDDTSFFQQGNWIALKTGLITVVKNILDLDSCRIEAQIRDSIPVNEIVTFLNKVNGKQVSLRSPGINGTLSVIISTCEMDFITWDVSVTPNRIGVGYDTLGGFLSHIFDYDGNVPKYVVTQQTIP